MFKAITLTAVALSLAAPAFAASDTATCAKVSSSQFQPITTLEAMLQNKGLKVVKVKTENGCYEAYTIDPKGVKATYGFNAQTLAPVANAEAGEN